jgi:hypothetical protein
MGEVATPVIASPDGDLHTPSHEVEFFARVQAIAGTIEVPLPATSFGGDTHLLKRYAEWKQQENLNGLDLSYEQFAKICGFAKQT